MNIINKVKTSFDKEIHSIAKKNIVRKLSKQGIDHNDISSDEFNELIEDEVKILESDTKKVGTGIAIGLAISMLTGF